MRTVIDILKEDHQRVRALLSKLDKTTTRATRARPELLGDIELQLAVHTTVEEDIFYPAIKQATKTHEQEEMVHEGLEEHRAVDQLVLPDLKKTPVDSVSFSGRAKVLKELVEHHADEEERKMFPMAQELFSEEELHELGERVMARKQELKRKLQVA